MKWAPAFRSFAVLALLFVSAVQAKTSADAKTSFEYDFLPSAVGNGRKSEGWFAAQLAAKWKSEPNENLRFQTLLGGEFLVLSPSTSTSSSQTPGSPQAGEWNKSGSPHFLEDQEFFFEYRMNRGRFAIGSRTLRWGIADFFDPLDQINSRRMERPIAAMKRGEWMISSEWQATDAGFSLETFVIPIKRGAILPSQTSPWLPRQLYIPNLPDAEFTLPASLEYKYRDREERDGALRWNAGARAVWRIRESEIAAQYDEGASSFPSIRPSVSGPLVGITPEGRRVLQADPLIELTEVYYRERHFGGSLVQPIGATLLRVQYAKTEPLYSGRELAHDRGDLMIAIERPIGLGSMGTVTVLAQGFKNLLEDQSGGTDLASFSKLFDRAAALGLRWALSETSALTVGALKSFSPKGGLIIMSAFSFDINSTLAAEIGWTSYEAALDSPIGPFKDCDGGSLKLTASF